MLLLFIVLPLGSTVTLSTNVVVNNLFTINGTFDPSTFTASGAAGITIANGGTIKVNTTLFTDNFNFSGTKNAVAGSTVEYLRAGDQTISSLFTYSTLKIGGSGIKSLAANLTNLRNTGATFGNIQLNAGTFDMVGFTANRTSGGTAGGTLTLANGTTLKLSGANTKTYYKIKGITKSIIASSFLKTYLQLLVILLPL